MSNNLSSQLTDSIYNKINENRINYIATGIEM